MSQTPQSAATPSVSPHRAVLNRYCVTCHNERLRTAELTLDKVNVDKIGENTEVWEKVVSKLRSRAMPPGGAPRPDEATYESLGEYLTTELDRQAAAGPNPGRPTSAHRLNRAEYTNAIRDLLGLEINGEAYLPADDSGGFDNFGDLLSVSPLLMEKYMSAAGKISRLAVGDRGIRPDVETYLVSPNLVQSDRMGEDLPFGSRGGIAVKHYFPLDGEYALGIRLQRTGGNGYVIGLAEPRPIDVRVDNARVKLLSIGGENVGKAEGAGAADALPPDFGQAQYERNADADLGVRFQAKAGTHLVQVTFLRENWVPEGAFPKLPRGTLAEVRRAEGVNHRGTVEPALSSIAISGPFDAKGAGETPSRKKIFVCAPSSAADEEPCAKRILSTLARRAYRRPVTDGDVAPLLNLYKSGRSEGDFEAGIEMALQGILVSTEFLFRIEKDPANVAPNTAYRISDLELASRLSFFLWSSIPDDELLDAAERGQLKDPAVLERQVQRMLADPRSRTLVENFAGQWLQLRNLKTRTPNRDVFEEFDESLRQAFQEETNLFLESMVREDRSVLDLLRSDYTFVNERLARHYGIPNVYGSRFRRVTLSDENRMGLLSQGSVLLLTSYANRTSVVQRGKWVLENILAAPPPPPPPNANTTLKEKSDDGKTLTMRQAMEQHRNNPACIGCHARMDPIGFALENFDAIGRWRTMDAGATIDPSGMLPDGSKFAGPAEMRKALLNRPQLIAYAVGEKLLTYALGRNLEHYDGPAVRKLVREAAPSDYRWSSIVLGIAKSTPFQMRRSRTS
jgi:hypothetical protein